MNISIYTEFKEEYQHLTVSKHIQFHECKQRTIRGGPFFKCRKQCHIFREEMELELTEKIKPHI